MAFNYLAKTTGRHDPSFVFGKSFDAIRRFIRLDESTGGQVVKVLQMPTDVIGMADRGELSAHFLALRWDSEPGEPILCLVRLFGVVEYLVRLSREPAAIWRDIASAHEYDLRSMRVIQVKHG